MFTDRIVVLKDGTIAECGNHDELVHRGGYYASLVRKHARLPALQAA